MGKRMLLIGLLIGELGGCTSDESDVVDGPISYLRAGIIRDSPIMSELHIDVDGTATRPKAGGGTEQALIDARILEDLDHKILAANFPALDANYYCDCRDRIVYVLAVQINGKRYHVLSESRAPPPARLQRVIDTLQSIADAGLHWQ